MDDVDFGPIPQTGNRPDYRQLKETDLTGSQPEEDPELAAQRASRHNNQTAASNAPGLFGGLLQLITGLSQADANKRPLIALLAGIRDRYAPEDLENRQIFITPRETEAVRYVAELPGGIKGLAKEDSYLFITEEYKNQSDFELRQAWDFKSDIHAYIMSRSDPNKWLEMEALMYGPATTLLFAAISTAINGRFGKRT